MIGVKKDDRGTGRPIGAKGEARQGRVLHGW